MKFEYARIRNVAHPNRGTEKSVGIDFFVPIFEESFINDLRQKNPKIQLINENKAIRLMPNESVLIPSGIKVHLPNGYFLNAFNKSGVASRKMILKMAETIDEDYQGEIHISVMNASSKLQSISENEKLIQFILLPALYPEITEIDHDQLFSEKTIRGENGFGSTNI